MSVGPRGVDRPFVALMLLGDIDALSTVSRIAKGWAGAAVFVSTMEKDLLRGKN